jgi:hypothetical protein
MQRSLGEMCEELRSIVHGKPGASAWNKLFKRLDKWSWQDMDALAELITSDLAAQLGPWEAMERSSASRWAMLALRYKRPLHAGFALCNRLNIKGCGLTTDELETMLAWPLVEHMRGLDLSYNACGLEAAQLLSRATTLGNMEALELRECPWPHQALCLILSNPKLSKLHTLRMGGPIWPEIDALHEHDPRALRTLGLSAQLEPAALETLWTWEARARLTELRLCPDRPGALATLVRASDAPGALGYLSLESSAIHDDDLVALIERGVLRQVHTLKLSECPNLTGAALELLGRAQLPALRKLWLRDTAVGQREAINALLASPLLRRLRAMELPSWKLSPEDLDALWEREDVNKNLINYLKLWL